MIKKGILLISCAVVLFLLFACNNKNEVPVEREVTDDSTKLSTFKDMWRALPLPDGIYLGDSWETEAFIIEFEASEQEITVIYESKDIEIDDCFSEGYVFMNAVTYPNDSFLFDSELFYMMALLEEVSSYSASATFNIPSGSEAIMLVLMVDGNVYNEFIFLK